MSKKAKHVGLWADRLKRDRDNPREVAFAEEWARENRRTTPTLDLLLYMQHGHGRAMSCSTACAEIPTLATYDKALVERDRIVAATVVQWLGSNIGFSFLESALKMCGYRIVKEERRITERGR